MGRKPLYEEWLKPEKLELLRSWKRRGMTNADIAKAIRINPTTLCEWKGKFPELAEALKETVSDEEIAAVESALYKSAKGYWVEEVETEAWEDANGRLKERHIKKKRRWIKPDVGAQCFILKNRVRDRWQDSPEPEKVDDAPKIIIMPDGGVEVG